MSAGNKRIKLAHLGRDSYISSSALSKLLHELSTQELPDAYSTFTIGAAIKQVVYQETSFGPLVQDFEIPVPGQEPVRVYIQHPLGFLEVASKTSAEFKDLLSRTLDASRDRLNLVLYSDEVTPGNQLSTANFRRTQAMYWTLKDFPNNALCCEYCWFTICALRQSEVDRLPGGLSQLWRYVVKQFMGAPLSHDLRNGISFTIPGESRQRLLFGEIAMFIQDERAHKYTTHVKGSGGHKCCVMCSNVVSKSSALLPDPTGFLVSSTCLDLDKLKLHTDDSVRAIQRRLAEAAASDSAELGDLETWFGFNFNAEGLLQDRSIDVGCISRWCWDYMHIYLVDGIFINEARELLQRLGKHKMGGDMFDKYVQHWDFPSGYPTAKKLCKGNKSFSPGGSASEQIAAAPILEKYLQDFVGPSICKCEVESALRLCEVISLLSVVNTGSISPSALGDAIMRHLHAHKAAYGETLWKPKTHWSVHLPRQLLEHGKLLGCFLMERKHRVLKRFAEPRRNTTGFDKGLVEESTLQHIHDLKDPLIRPDLLEPRPAGNKLRSALSSAMTLHYGATVLTAKSAYIHSRVVSMGDTVSFYRDDGCIGFGLLYFLARVNDDLIGCIADWEVIDRTSTHVKCIVRDLPRLMHGSCVLESCCSFQAGVGKVSQVLLTPKLRTMVHKLSHGL